MFKVNDYVVYGLTGICRIADIKKDEYNDANDTEYYVLYPVFNKNITIMTPVNNPHNAMRSIITRDDVSSLLAMPDKETIWIDNDIQRTNSFRAALKTGKPEEWIKIIKTLYLEKRARARVGKKLTKADEEILNTAEKHLQEEFAIVLNISPNEVLPYILEHISQNRVLGSHCE